MDLVLLAVKADLNNSLNAGRYMLVSFFLLAVFIKYIGILSHNVNWADVILRLVIGFILLQNYVWIMDTTRNTVVSVDEMINPNQDFVSQFSNMSKTIQKKHEDTTNQSILSQVTQAVVNFGRYTIRNLIINLSFVFYALISKVMEAVRFSLVAILYKLGPVLIPFVLFQSTGSVVKGWFTSYVSALCWPILWHIVLSIAVTLGNQLMTTGGLEQFACLNLSLCFVLIFSPFIVNSLVAGVGAGSSAAIGGIVSTNTATKLLAISGQGGIRTAAYRVFNPMIQNSTILPGKFKNFMLGDDKDKGAKT